MELKKTFLGFIGGSGLYNLPEIKNVKQLDVETPFGSPSDKIFTGQIGESQVAFLPRHGVGHRILPSEVNYRANIYALKKIGVTHIVSVSAVGSLQIEHPPGSILIPDQIIDKTLGQRQRTFFGNGIVGHVSFSRPFCSELRSALKIACQDSSIDPHFGGTAICIEGPRFSTMQESIEFKSLKADIIGMTSMPEAILAREAEIPYAMLACVTDYDSWHVEMSPVTLEMVMQILNDNIGKAKQILSALVRKFPLETANPIFSSMQNSILTQQKLIPKATQENLGIFYRKYWE